LTIGTITILDLADESGLLDFEQALLRLLATNFHVEDALLKPVRATHPPLDQSKGLLPCRE
jgi:hypothetical protein